jgi:SAM-dependent methyltransferase
MMFGKRDPFTYFACAECGCVQLTDPPADLGAYYPSNYYALAQPTTQQGFKSSLRAIRNRGSFAPRGIMDRLLARAVPGPGLNAGQWMPKARASRTSRVLDVGCGAGLLLCDLAEAGFTSLRGVDLFIDDDIRYPNGVHIQRGTIHDVSGEFDLIMMHHAFEHMPDPQAVLTAVASRLAQGGACLIRIPTASSWAWEHYRENWVQLDPPRHFFLHSVDSLSLLAQRAGLVVEDVVDDSTEFQFAGSELYRRDIPLTALETTYSRAELRAYRRRAAVLNATRRGDQAAFYLRKPSASV